MRKKKIYVTLESEINCIIIRETEAESAESIAGIRKRILG
jgi:hypothetical protein